MQPGDQGALSNLRRLGTRPCEVPVLLLMHTVAEGLHAMRPGS